MALVSLLLLTPSAAAFTPSAPSVFGATAAARTLSAAPPPLPVCLRPRVSLVEMVTAQEVFGQYFEAAPPVQKTMQTLPPPVAKGALAGLVAVTGAVGFLITPSRRIAVNTVGGAIGAGVGNLVRKRVSAERQQSAMAVMAAKLAAGLAAKEPTDTLVENIAAVASEYEVPKKQFGAQCGELYLIFLNAVLSQHQVQTAELSEILRLQQLLCLSPAQAGNQVYAAARKLYSRHRAYLEDSGPNDSKKLLEKFVFLAERVLARDESPEGYRYESLRLQKLLGLTKLDWRKMAEDAAVPFYEKALESAVIQGKVVTSSQLAQVRESLGISTSSAEAMHTTVFATAAASMLEGGSCAALDKERIRSISNLLEMAPDVMGKTLQALTAPLYTGTFECIVAELDKLGDADETFAAQQAGVLALHAQQLLLEPSNAHALEAGVLRRVARGKLAEAAKFLRLQDVPQGLQAVSNLVSFCVSASSLMIRMRHVGASDIDSALPMLFGSLKGGTKQSELLALYRVLLLDYLQGLTITDEQADSLTRLRTLLGICEAEATSIYQAAAGPLFRKAVAIAVAGGAGPEQKAELQASVASLALPTECAAAISAEVYREKLRVYARDGQVMSEDQAAELEKLRDFLTLAPEDVYGTHSELCGEAYRSSVRQVMSVSGSIPDEYFEGLSRLRTRLGLSEASAEELYCIEVTARMKDFGKRAIEVLTQKAEKQQAAGGGEKGAMAIDGLAISTEVLNLVDFAMATKALIKQQVAGKDVEVCNTNLRGEFEDRTLKELYKQYLIEAFSGTNGAENQRLFDNLSRLGLVLGLDSGDVQAIHNDIGGYIYRSYISKALPKGPLGPEETSFLASIKDVLGLEQELCDDLVKDCQTNRISVLVESMFEKSAVLAEDVRKMRDEADMYEVDLEMDLQLSTFKLERMFQCELEDLVDSGDLNNGDMSALAEAADPLKVSEERAAAMLEATVLKRTSGGVLQAAAALRQGSIDSARTEIDKMLRFAALLPDRPAEAKAVSIGEKNELYMVYQAGQMTAGATPESAAKLELLKAVMGLVAA